MFLSFSNTILHGTVVVSFTGGLTLSGELGFSSLVEVHAFTIYNKFYFAFGFCLSGFLPNPKLTAPKYMQVKKILSGT